LGVGRGAPPEKPDTIFVLRNNDIGDLIVVTPLFEALKSRFPAARVVAGVGDWNRSVLLNNPHVDEVIRINAPWHNQVVAKQGLVPALDYIRRSPEVAALARLRCDVGIDVLGSPFGSLLMLRTKMPWRIGRRGYAGGHTGVNRFIDHDPTMHVGREALLYAQMLGAQSLPDARPRIYLSSEELNEGNMRWRRIAKPDQLRIVIGPGGGFAAKCWPLSNYIALSRRLQLEESAQVMVVGGPKEASIGKEMNDAVRGVENLAGLTTLRETFALVACADLVFCNSSMLMHAAAAFQVPAVVLLGEHFESASAHAQLWGHADSVVLGKEAGRGVIASVQEALQQLRKLAPSPRSC